MKSIISRRGFGKTVGSRGHRWPHGATGSGAGIAASGHSFAKTDDYGHARTDQPERDHRGARNLRSDVRADLRSRLASWRLTFREARWVTKPLSWSPTSASKNGRGPSPYHEAAVNIPVMVDVGAGFGEPAHLLRTVRFLGAGRRGGNAPRRSSFSPSAFTTTSGPSTLSRRKRCWKKSTTPSKRGAIRTL